MRWSRFFKGAVIVSMATALAAVPIGSAVAEEGSGTATLTVDPNSVETDSTNTFTLTYTISGGGERQFSEEGGGSVECVVFTLVDFTDLANPAMVTPASGWGAALGTDADQVTATGTPASNTVSITVDATAPGAPEVATWTADGYAAEDCSGTPHSASADVTVTQALNPTTTTILCATGAPTVGDPDACHVTTTDTSGSPSNPTGAIAVSILSGGGSLSGSTCGSPTPSGVDSEECDVNYTPGSTGNKHLQAVYPGDSSHDGSNGTATLGAVNGTGGPCHCRPDMLIRLAHHSWKGNNIYSGTGHHESIKVAAHAGQTWVVYLRAENDGTAADDITITGQQSRPFIKVHYYHGSTNITHQVIHHVYVQHLAPGGHTLLRMTVHLLAGVRAGVTRVFPVEARSGLDDTVRDVVKFKTNIFKV